MAPRVEYLKDELIDKAVRLARDRLEPEKALPAERFIRLYYANVAPEDVIHREAETLYGAAMGLLNLARQRRPGALKLRVYDPRLDEHGWHSDHTVVEIVNDDMPFLVDSVTAALNHLDVAVHLIIHPIVAVLRDGVGRLEAVVEPGTDGAALESFMHVEIDRQSEARVETDIAAGLEAVLGDVRAAVEDWHVMRDRAMDVLGALGAPPPGCSGEEVAEVRDFLRWIHDDHFTFLGYRRLTFAGGELDGAVAADPDSGLGILRDPRQRVFDESRDVDQMPAEITTFLRRPSLLLITKADRTSPVHRPVPMDIVGVKWFDEDGRPAGMHAVVGLFGSAAYTRSPTLIPVLRRKVAYVVRRAGFRPSSHDGKALLHILENFPRDELFQISEDALLETALGILRLQERQRVALFVRRDEFGRFVSCLVFVPRDRYNTDLRLAIAGVLESAFEGRVATFHTQLGDSPLARLYLIVKNGGGGLPAVDVSEIESRIAEAARSWADHLQEALVASQGEVRGLVLYRRYGNAFPASYRERHSAQTAIYDIQHIEATLAGGGLEMNLYRPVEAAENEARFKIYNAHRTVPLSDVLPMLENMGFRVISEVPHRIRLEGDAAWIHDFAVETVGAVDIDIGQVRDRFQDAFRRVWIGEAEDDGFNRLVLLAGANWREVTLLRSYAKYLRQIGSAFSQAYMEGALVGNPALTRLLAQLFHLRFDPARRRDPAAEEAIVASFEKGLDKVTSADDDRILRRFLNLIQSSMRTNFFQPGADGLPKGYIALKLDSRNVDEMPLPCPWVEVFVYSPRVEAIHLRGGKVARGGIRWSDRREDFRTEVLGLMKAQMVKNAVIIPVGAKGGFVVKRPPLEGREAQLEEGIFCYRTMMRGLLDITDNLMAGEIVPPPAVVRHDGDDPYLVVAADKGTATFSDIANGISAEYGFWLDDAFASGGTNGYDHKAMGITARGAWVSVERHFREIGIDVQTTDFTAVGVGDMAGDVFGNGMLRSAHTRLVGAFNHLHIFCDPDPDPAASFAERKRLFELPRSQWSDYDPALISKGGGVFRRDAKLLQPSPEIRERFAIPRETVTPNELVRAMLKARVDLLFFGGIGTFVKCSDESNAAAGDRANDAVRVDAGQLGAKVVGEGANLAMTQLARIEFALAGGRLNTDAIDNSAGVDTSDHEVNIKILLNEVVGDGDITLKQRNELLSAMTDEVAELVLRDNYQQTQSISLSESRAAELLGQHERMMRMLEKAGRLNRPVEFLPDDETLAERAGARRGLTRPEIAVLLSYAKIWLYEHVLESGLPDDPLLVEELDRYFPTDLRDRYGDRAARHRLRREIVATQTTNSMINRVGPSFISDITERTGMPPEDIARAYLVVRDAFALRDSWDAIEALDNRVPAAVQYAMLGELNRLVERGVIWLLRHGARPLEIGTARAELEPPIAVLRGSLERILPEDTLAAVRTRAEDFRREGVPEDLACRIASSIVLVSATDIVRVGSRTGLEIEAAASLYFTVGARFALGWLRAMADQVGGGPAAGHWLKLAVAAMIDDLYGLQRDLTLKIAEGDGGLEAWLDANRPAVERADQLLAEARAAATPDLAVLTVAARQLRALTEG